jgi:N-acetylneuraminic acid mutarotase
MPIVNIAAKRGSDDRDERLRNVPNALSRLAVVVQRRKLSAMKKLSVQFLLLAFCLQLSADEPKLPNMPTAVSSNAVASLKGGLELYSLMGIGPKKTWNDVSNKIYILHLTSTKWMEGKPVPGVAGRLGAAAVGAKGHIYVFGGYVLDGQGNQITVSDVNAYVPDEHRWYRGNDIPVPVDQAVIGLNRDRYVYLIGGRSKSGPVNNVQVYDVERNAWSQATPFPGPPVFGHAGGITDEEIVYADGAMKNPAAGAPYVASQECWLGKIDHKDPNKIEWSKLPAHPGPAHFGMAGGVADKGKILFSGGTAVPHDFKGNGYDGKPAEASQVTFVYEMHGSKWQVLNDKTPDARLDGRGVINTPAGAVILGGLAENSSTMAQATILTRK